MASTLEQMFNDLIDGYSNGIRDTEIPQDVPKINFNDYYSSETYEDSLKSVKVEIWEKLLKYFGDQDAPIENFPNPNSLFGHIANKIDGVNNLPLTVWNISVNNAIQTFISLFGENGQIKLTSNGESGGYVAITDVRHADAGLSFKKNPYVKPNNNINDQTYLQVRNGDEIKSVLQSQDQMQFTNNNRMTDQEMATFIRNAASSSRDVANHYNQLEDTWNASIAFISDELRWILNYWDIEYEADDSAFEKIIKSQGIIFSQYLLSYAESYPQKPIELSGYTDIENFQKTEPMWIRLLMPKYLRIVEVEDLNRNFWVIGQVVSAICAFLFGDNGLPDLLETLLKEIVGLWENVLYLWASMALLTDPIDRTYHCEVVTIPNNEFQIQKKFDYFNESNESFINDSAENCKEEIINRIRYIINAYPKQNLIIIPEIRMGNYKHNYYSKVIYPGVYIYNRKLNKGKWFWFNVSYDQSEVSQSMIPIRSFTNDNITPLIIDLELDSKDYNLNTGPFYLDHIYGLREEEASYDYLYPYTETFKQNRAFYGFLRVVPEIEIQYGDPSYVLDSISIKFKIYDAAKQAIFGDDTNTLLFTYDTGNQLIYISTDFINDNAYDLIGENNYKNYPSISTISVPINTDIIKGYYAGELVSYWNISILDDYANFGVPYWGTPLPDSGYEELLNSYGGF